MRAGAAIAAAILLASSGARAEDATTEDEAPDPAQIARELAAAREALERVRRSESSALVEVDRAEAAVRAAVLAARAAARELEAASAEVETARAAEEQAARAVEARLADLAPRLLVRYRLLRQGRAAVLLDAPSAAELVRREAGFSRVLAADVDAARRARAAQEALAAARERAAAARETVRLRAEQARASEGAARAATEARRVVLAAVRDERGLQEQVIRELARAQAALAAAVAALPSAEARGFGKLKGKLVFPVAAGIVEVPYGKMVNPRFNTVTFHRGVDVRAPEGSEVVAVGAGRVVHAGWFGGYGNLVIVDHGDGYHSLYAHLAAIHREVGAEVAQAEPLGLLGDTGSLKGAYLYFEIREAGKPVDPGAWLGRR